jgi:hypothetical protein
MLFLICAAGWARSYSVGDELGRLWQSDNAKVRVLRGISLAHGRGAFRIWIIRIEQAQPAGIEAPDQWVYSPHVHPQAITNASRLILGFGGYGIAWQTKNDFKSEATERISGVILPYWTTFIFLAPAIAACVVAARRHRQAKAWRRAGRCGQCGYDLRSSADRCPECGNDTGGSVPAETEAQAKATS